MTYIPLKTRLQAIKANEYQLPADVDAFDLAKEMINEIGSLDPELRDNLIYSTLGRWIEIQRLFTPEQLRTMLDILLDEDHLQLGLGEVEGEEVFTRTFSILLVACILVVQHTQPFLTADEVQMVKREVIGYLLDEKDVRGYVPEMGWAHSAAHTADALSELAGCTEMGSEDLQEILTAIQTKLGVVPVVFSHAEEERLANAVDSVMERGLLSDADWQKWIKGFTPLASHTSGMYIFLNIKNFLQSLFLRAHQNGWSEAVRLALLENLTDIRKQWHL